MLRITILSGISSIIIPLVAYLIIRKINIPSKLMRPLKTGILLSYLFIILYLTLIKRKPGTQMVNLAPFWSYRLFCQAEIRWQIYMNVFLFMPFGFLLAMITGKWWRTVLSGFFLSVSVEFAQYMFGLGLCEIDDVVHNTFGTGIGYFLWKDMEKLYRLCKMKEKHHIIKPSQEDFLLCLGVALSGGTPQMAQEHIIEAQQQAVLPLISSGINTYYSIIAKNIQIANEQKHVDEALRDIPYVVLKGLAAAVYYPEPIKRTLGDIDIIVRPTDFLRAYRALELFGYKTNDSIDGTNRHVNFYRNGILIELHRKFSILNTTKAEELLDGWIYEAIPSATRGCFRDQLFPMLPDQLNGLTLLAHISQHLEGGLGIRQIIDWVMYIKHSLTDESWPEFREKTDKLGLTKIAQVTARIGQRYMGLDKVTWCNDVDDRVADDLLNYIFECGNFGTKLGIDNTLTMVISHGRGIRGFFKNLQRQGKANWKELDKHSWLKSFAWIYQSKRYIRLGFKSVSVKKVWGNMLSSKRRNRLMDELEVTRYARRD